MWMLWSSIARITTCEH